MHLGNLEARTAMMHQGAICTGPHSTSAANLRLATLNPKFAEAVLALLLFFLLQAPLDYKS